MKIAVIGAGSIGFTRGIVSDLLSVPEFRDNLDIAFTDISKRNLDMVYKICRRDMEANGVRSKISATLDRRVAFKNADYVFCVVRVGGLEGFQTDIDIPLKYGVDQCVGDTLCAGGIMYAQRGIAAMLGFCKDISEVAKPGCMLITHTNPMAMCTWACSKYGCGVPVVGLCHGVEGGHWQIANVLGLEREEVDIICAGINHQTWYIQVRHKGKDLTGKLLAAFEKHPVYSRTEKVRIDMLRRFGYYSTESNGHLSEYVPWYRKRPKEIRKWIDLGSWINGETGGYLRVCTEGRNWFETDFPNWMKGEPAKYDPARRGGEHGPYIIESLETGRRYRGHFNVMNNGCITNLPDDCCVEVPCYVDANGIGVPQVGDLPLGCAGVLNNTATVQRLGVEAAVNGDDMLLRQAMMLDPLTGAVCDPPEIWQMVDEMLVAQAKWLPQYRKTITAAKKRLAKAKRSGTLIKTREGYKGAARLHTKTVAEMKKNAAAARRSAAAAAADKPAEDRDKDAAKGKSRKKAKKK
ncbi:MAG: alpha-glucosidase/alpha-galactosidase [Planctomycetota bacterium]